MALDDGPKGFLIASIHEFAQEVAVGHANMLHSFNYGRQEAVGGHVEDNLADSHWGGQYSLPWFAGHDESAHGRAILWSRSAIAQRHEIDVQFYLRNVPAHRPVIAGESGAEKLESFYPHVWKQAKITRQNSTSCSDREPDEIFRLNARHAWRTKKPAIIEDRRRVSPFARGCTQNQ
jgi:hypothetical protein